MKTNVADRPLTLAAHLRRVAALLRNGQVDYEWTLADQCNVGLVARAALGLSRSRFRKLEKPIKAEVTWEGRAQNYCPISGLPEIKIFRLLHEAGFRFEDYREVESLSNVDVLERIEKDGHLTKREMQTRTRRKWWGKKITETTEREIRHEMQEDDEKSLALYLEVWATLIEEHHGQPTDAAMEAAESRPLVAVK